MLKLFQAITHNGRENNCHARIHVRGGLVIKQIGEYTPALEPGRVEALNITGQFMRKSALL